MKLWVSILSLVFCTTLLFASVTRVELSAENQVNSPIDYKVKVLTDHPQKGRVDIRITLAADQDELAELWKVYLWVSDEKKIVLSVPLDMKRSKDGAIEIHFNGSVEMVNNSVIAVRCGKHAPLAEKIYQINVGSYLKASE